MNFLKLTTFASRLAVIVLGGSLALSACSFTESALWPSLAGGGDEIEQKSSRRERTSETPGDDGAATADQRSASSPPRLGSSTFVPDGVTAGRPTGTFVGQKIVELRDELKRLQGSIVEHNDILQGLRANIVRGSRRYHGNVAEISARLQVGTTPGNPILVRQFNTAQADLDRVAADVTEMNKLAGAVTGDSTMSNFLAEAARSAFTVSGAVDEDHRQLAILEDEIDKTSVLIERLLTETAEDVRRQTNYVTTERSNLNLLSAGIKSGEIYGASLMNKAMLAKAGSAVGAAPIAARDTSGRRPLVVIRFDRNNVPYQQALYTAVSRVLERRPNAAFDLVAVAPKTGGDAQIALNANKAHRLADGVRRSLLEMGLPSGRIALGSKTSAAARGNEVHLYLRRPNSS